jgi:hypothetical protein
MNNLIASAAAPTASLSAVAYDASLTAPGKVGNSVSGVTPAGWLSTSPSCASSLACSGNMKNLLLLCTTAVAAVFASAASAQTTFNGTGTGAALDIDLSGNWTNGLPTSALNPGTISTNSTVDASTGNFTYTGYYITLTGGTMTQFNLGNDPTFSGGSFTVNGGTYGPTGTRGITFSNGNVATLTSGAIRTGSNGGVTINSSSLAVNGGTLELQGSNRNIALSNNSSLAVNGGTVTMVTSNATGYFGVNQLATGNNTINLNGGNTTANFLAFGNNASTPRLRLSLGGSTEGSFTAVNFLALSGNEVIGARRIDWMPDSLMTMTMTAAASTWAETEWAAGRMTYNGSGNGTFGNWSTVTTTGFGDGNRFNMSGNTLSIVAVPEPSTLALVGMAGAGFLVLGRMRKRGRRS